MATWGMLAPSDLAETAATITHTIFASLDWFFMGSVTAFLLLTLWLGLGRYGRLRLGGPDEKPEFTTASWLSMLFSAGMGVGILFWGVAEPMTHYVAPPVGSAETAHAARRAMVLTNLHWGLHAWSVYCVGALVLGYFAFRRGGKWLAGAPLRLVFRGSWVNPVANLADGIAVIAIAFGVAGSLVMGAMQLQTGLNVTLGWSADSAGVGFGILAVLTVAYMLSAATSLDKGIQLLSNANVALALLLLVFVLLAGPTGFLLRSAATALGDYLSALPALSLSLYPYRDTGGWLEAWTLTYFIWWIAWAPFVGIFIARISRGRTIREFVLGVTLTPTLLSILWFAVFGGTGLHAEMTDSPGFASVVAEDVTLALFTLYETLPGSTVLTGVSLVLIFVFLVTSADSATFVLGMLSSAGSLDPPRTQKLGWGVGLALMAGGLLLARSIDAVRAVVVLGAIPFTFILVLQVVALLRVLPGDLADELARAAAEDEADPPPDGASMPETAPDAPASDGDDTVAGEVPA